MGVIFGTGVNGAFYDVVSDIEKLEGKLADDIPRDSPMAINCEYGSFDNEHLVLPRTKYDVDVDEQSPRPGQQAFEKMTSGYYLGELLRMVLIDLNKKGLMLKGQDLTKLSKPYIMDTSYPARIEEDPFENLEDTDDIFQKDFGIKTSLPERKLIRRLCELIGTRAARLGRLWSRCHLPKERLQDRPHCRRRFRLQLVSWLQSRCRQGSKRYLRMDR